MNGWVVLLLLGCMGAGVALVALGDTTAGSVVIAPTVLAILALAQQRGRSARKPKPPAPPAA